MYQHFIVTPFERDLSDQLSERGSPDLCDKVHPTARQLTAQSSLNKGGTELLEPDVRSTLSCTLGVSLQQLK